MSDVEVFMIVKKDVPMNNYGIIKLKTGHSQKLNISTFDMYNAWKSSRDKPIFILKFNPDSVRKTIIRQNSK